MKKGFTVIELLIVIVVIGILAAIGLVSYSGFQNRAQDASVQSDLETIAGELEAYRVRDTTQRFPINASQLETLELTISKNAYDLTLTHNLIYCVATSGADEYQAYKLIAESKSGAIFMMTQDGFVQHSLTSSNMNTSLCSSQSMSVGAYGMTTGPSWATWVSD